MSSKKNLDLNKELNNSRNIQSKITKIIQSKENDLKLLYEKKTRHDENYFKIKKHKDSLQSKFILILKKIIEEKKVLINKLIEHNKKKDEIINDNNKHNKNLLIEKDNKIKFYQNEHMELSNQLFNSKKNYNVLQKNLMNLELEKIEIVKKVIQLNNTLNPKNIVEIKSQNTIVNKTIKDLDHLEKKDNDKGTKYLDSNKADLDKVINKIFE